MFIFTREVNPTLMVTTHHLSVEFKLARSERRRLMLRPEQGS